MKNPHEFVAKLRPNSILRTHTLYELEPIMGECSGHGCGFGGEDIDWLISEKKKDWWKTLSIDLQGCYLRIRFTKFCWEVKEAENLPLSSLPAPKKNIII
ncbi:MAG: hypothetical protein WC390_10300 [Sulfurimonas sp.]